MFRSKDLVSTNGDAPQAPRFALSFARMAGLVILAKLVLLTVSWASIATARPGELHPTFAPLGIPLFAWDSMNYLQILKEGYPGPGTPPNLIAFFPLYPLVSWPLSHVLGASASLLLTANLASLFGYCLFHLWAWRLTDERTARLATLVALAYPAAFFASCAYTEGPFVLATAGVLLLLQQRRFVWAALVAMLAGGLRPPGVLLGLLVAGTVAVLGWPTGWRCRVRSLGLACLLAAGSTLGLGAYQGFLAARYGDSSVYFKAQSNWNTAAPAQAASPAAASDSPAPGSDEAPVANRTRSSLQRVWDKAMSLGAWNKALGLAVLVTSALALVLPGAVPRLAFLFCIGVFLIGYLPGHGARASSMARMLLVALPCFLFIAERARRWPRLTYALLGLCALAQIVYVAAFSRGIWTG